MKFLVQLPETVRKALVAFIFTKSKDNRDSRARFIILRKERSGNICPGHSRFSRHFIRELRESKTNEGKL